MKHTPENLVKKEIKDYLDATGWFHFPITQGLGSYKGICDRIAIKQGVVLFIECKAPGGYLTKHQKEFRARIIENGGYYVLAWGYEDIEEYLKCHHLGHLLPTSQNI